MSIVLHAGLAERSLLLLAQPRASAAALRRLVEENFSQLDTTGWQRHRAVVEGRSVDALSLQASDAAALLCACAGREMIGPNVAIGDTLAYWCSALRLGAEIVAAQRFLPSLEYDEGQSVYRAVWAPVLGERERKLAAVLASTMPDACRIIGGRQAPPRVVAAAALERFLKFVVDGLVRAAATPIRANGVLPLHDRWMCALRNPDSRLSGVPGELRGLSQRIESWRRAVLEEGASENRLCLRVEEPQADDDPWRIVYLLQNRDDPSLLIDAASAWSKTGLRRALLASLGRAAQVSSHIRASLNQGTSAPWGFALDTVGAYAFLSETTWLLEQAGVGMILPAWWLGKNTKTRLSTRTHVKSPATNAGLRIDSLVNVDWSVAIGDASLTARELERLAKLKLPLVRLRGQWVHVDANELRAALDRLRSGIRRLSLGEIVRMQLDPNVSVEARGKVGRLLERLQGRRAYDELPPPVGLQAVLRPYQLRGYSWLRFLTAAGFGACLADDMGLGKTIQALTLVLRDWQEDGEKAVLVVCPTSVIGNWMREAQRFAPGLPVSVHHGSNRIRGTRFAREARKHALVITSYSLLQRDVESFNGVRWRGIVLDEAQNVKNPESKQARAARTLEAGYRIALTGTPVENHVGDLWSVMEFLNPGMLGSRASFKRDFLIPIQAMRNRDAADRLKRLSGPFVLRRLKSDPAIISDLPAKNEMTVFCTLTREQGSLYAAVLRDYEATVDDSEGMQRRGRILALLLKLKQICNHPAQFAQDRSPIEGRSGKLARLEDMLEEVFDVGERALVFTQFAAMGEIIVRRLTDRFGREVLFLHGGVSKRRRDEMVERFQSERGPALFVLSLKAGGSGLNLTQANHVFHFDRWWNPAVENQATDRAFRIGQEKNVQVHKFVCVGTLEEKIDALIEGKRAVAEQVVGSGEAWLTELSNQTIRELVALSPEAVED
ncbi:MAG: DEAD/DEAH box helicase family protein [Candidatus Eremiobacteraeota bacterium]|nr:DEAD/DEAH box helicase family protein [Candidatus Eremiobacteraeota bacterium]